MIFDVNAIEEKIGYSFSDKMLLRKCFTHSSYANEHNEECNEKLEFFGDAIIEFVVTDYLYNNFPGDEGKLTDKRKSMVSNANLLREVEKLGLKDFLLLGKGQKKSLNLEEKIFASIFESLTAGIYIDGGLSQVKKFLKKTIITDFIKVESDNKNSKKSADAKSEFQEYVQKHKLGSISYEMLSKSGPDHLPEFRVAAILNGSRLAEGVGSSKRHAEAIAAESALKKITRKDGE